MRCLLIVIHLLTIVRRRFDREPSRIPVKQLEKLSRKNKKNKEISVQANS